MSSWILWPSVVASETRCREGLLLEPPPSLSSGTSLLREDLAEWKLDFLEARLEESDSPIAAGLICVLNMVKEIRSKAGDSSKNRKY